MMHVLCFSAIADDARCVSSEGPVLSVPTHIAEIGRRPSPPQSSYRQHQSQNDEQQQEAANLVYYPISPYAPAGQ